MRVHCLYLLLLAALPAAAQIYRYTDAHGNTAYSDQPPAGAPGQAVELAPLNRIEAPRPLTPPGVDPVQTPPSRAPAYTTLELSGVPDGGVVRANNGTFEVEVRLQPPLLNEHRLRLLLDDQPYGQPGNLPNLQLVNIDRGEHRLAVQVLDGERVVQQSPQLTFTLQRVHRP
ncbi:DUF4124 domain-containing protein [Pseudomonas chlororaphis]|uniref:DUF4124 domain-containing protein n=1 Tax=Pseudomonas chlororaphis TaxID=587753 RepID=UPI000F553F9B|nr:DUF4124 domain-containing protein [Pseudomonas chlororaphis]AZD45838.1 DNA-directed RNA polymerase, beta subunit [Pseudomonas chlororaphis subsp. aurantiaca]